jgi:hypothetical protein
MKIEGQAIPPELAAAYARLISNNPTSQSGTTIARTRRAAKQSQAQIARNAHEKNVERLIESLHGLHAAAGDPRLHPGWRYDRKSALLDGTIEEEYWTPCELLGVQCLRSAPSSVIDTSPHTYSYRDDNMMPTIPTYPDGTGTTDNPSYDGLLSGSLFTDQQWTWRRSVWRRDEDIYNQARAACFAFISGSLQVDASNRASRPMLSIANDIQSAEEAADFLADATAPSSHAWRHYWRYELPPAVAPYWHGSIERRILQPLSASTSAGAGRAVMLRTSPSPMKGRGFNNNTTIKTNFQGYEALYEPVGMRPLRRMQVYVNPFSVTYPVGWTNPGLQSWISQSVGTMSAALAGYYRILPMQLGIIDAINTEGKFQVHSVDAPSVNYTSPTFTRIISNIYLKGIKPPWTGYLYMGGFLQSEAIIREL